MNCQLCSTLAPNNFSPIFGVGDGGDGAQPSGTCIVLELGCESMFHCLLSMVQAMQFLAVDMASGACMTIYARIVQKVTSGKN